MSCMNKQQVIGDGDFLLLLLLLLLLTPFSRLGRAFLLSCISSISWSGFLISNFSFLLFPGSRCPVVRGPVVSSLRSLIRFPELFSRRRGEPR
jgi:hypothetical protein